MKVTIKRPIEGTVPRKLELVNVSCVSRHMTFERPAAVSQKQGAVHISFVADASDAEMASFWELEALIERGFQRDLALDVIAARRMQRRPKIAVMPASAATQAVVPAAVEG